jgi:hypothetical protein
MSLTMIIGTGRCGSTMLSRILRMHPEILSISEFWRAFPQEEGSSDIWNLFSQVEASISAGDISGAEFWRQITVIDTAIDGMADAGIFIKAGGDQIGFDPTARMPPIWRVLMQLTDDPDPLYQALAAEVPRWPSRPTADHCRALFAEMSARLGRDAIVERTGASASLMPMFREQFPEARYLFLHRDGPDSSMSMSRNPFYRLAVMRIMVDAVSNPSPALPADMLPTEIGSAGAEEFRGLIAPPFDAIRFMEYPLPPQIFGWLWSLMTRIGTREIRQVPSGRWTTMRYEHLIENPRTELTRLASFIGVTASPQWLAEAEEWIDPGRPGKAASRLHARALDALKAACAAGTRAFDLLESEHAVLLSVLARFGHRNSGRPGGHSPG